VRCGDAARKWLAEHETLDIAHVGCETAEPGPTSHQRCDPGCNSSASGSCPAVRELRHR
jgi:hypothetical protein